MLNNKFTLVALFLAQQLISACSFANNLTEDNKRDYVINYSEKNKPYYHVMFELNKSNVVKLEVSTQDMFFQKGGQFEVLIERAHFPIDAPNCQSHIILRMPWSFNRSAIEKKYQLYRHIQDVVASSNESISVAIELNPYVKKVGDGLQLTYCNAFFRHANGEYIPHVRSLK